MTGFVNHLGPAWFYVRKLHQLRANFFSLQNHLKKPKKWLKTEIKDMKMELKALAFTCNWQLGDWPPKSPAICSTTIRAKVIKKFSQQGKMVNGKNIFSFLLFIHFFIKISGFCIYFNLFFLKNKIIHFTFLCSDKWWMFDDDDESHFSYFLDSLSSYENIAECFSLWLIKCGVCFQALFRHFKSEKMVELLLFRTR